MPRRDENLAACRICHAPNPVFFAEYRPYVDFATALFECPQCGCRFSAHDETAYEKMYTTGESHYAWLDDVARQVKEHLARGDTRAARRFLCREPKFHFVIDTIDRTPDAWRLMEMGCSRGFLTAYFAATGRDVIGADISPSAIDFARNLFGDHFVLATDPAVVARAPYDAIYHTGTIGCVQSPLEFTQNLLGLLRPGGVLAFNVPSLPACRERNQMWLDISPPDVVTLFPADFWSRHFQAVADVTVTNGYLNGAEGLRWTLRNRLGRKAAPAGPTKRVFFDRHNSAKRSPGKLVALTRAIRQSLKVPLQSLLSLAPWPKYLAPYGMYVRMVKRP